MILLALFEALAGHLEATWKLVTRMRSAPVGARATGRRLRAGESAR